MLKAMKQGSHHNNGNVLLKSLLLPGQALVFVDDSGTHGKQLPNLVADYECLCGVAMNSEAYAQVHAKSMQIVRMLPIGLDEFHATELVNPPERHPWKTVPVKERADVLVTLFSCVSEHCQIIYQGFYSGEQMKNTPEMASRQDIMRKGPKKAVETVFRNSLVPHLLDGGSSATIIWDSAKPAIKNMNVETMSRPGSTITCDIIHADSRYVFGLQLADLIAYSFNRLHRIRQRAQQGVANEMDNAILDGLILLKGRFVDVLALPEPSWANVFGT